jgi:hypothetical protein
MHHVEDSMRKLCLAAALLLATLAPGGAAPPAPLAGAGQTDVVQVRGCHADVRRHYVPQYGRSVAHYHRRNCRPVRAGMAPPIRRDCHRDVRVHRINGVLVRHRHVGPYCAVRVVRRFN